MLSGLVMALSVAMSPGQCATCGPGGMAFQPGMASGSWVAGAGGGYNPYDSVASGGGGGGDQLYPLDSPEPWLHGYFQDMPAYSGYSSFRPHNYKHVLAQMQTASRWGIPSTMPISHQWYHQYRQRAGMHPSWDTNLASNGGGAGYQNYAAAPVPQQQVVQTSAQPQSGRPQYSQALDQAAALERGYPGTPIPGISTPNYQRSAATYRSMPTFSQQYSERFETLKDQLEQQSFHLQVMQQQLQEQQSARNTYRQAHDQFNGQAWAQPNHTQFNDPSQGSGLQPPGVFVAPQSAMPAQPAVMNPPQGLGQSMSPYSSQQNPGQQFSNGYSAQGMQQTAPQGFNPQMAP
ncbi:MAG: hypothetical protein O2820_22825, partial [Planctomycetota bacterium]|nr:hypothetical protein [Planctomycetota bacterium]